MRICTFYLQDKKVIYRITGKNIEEGEFNSSEVEAFLEKVRPDVLNVIISKPQLIFRKIEFPFRNKRKVYIVLPSEIEDTLPEGPDNFLFSFDFLPLEKNRTMVNVYAIPTALFNYWDNLAKKYRANLYLFSDALLFYQFLKQSTDEKSYVAIYVEDNYVLLNIVEDGILAGSYSFEFTPALRSESITLIKGILGKKDFSVFICAPQEIKEELAIGEEKVRYINLPAGMEKRYLFHHLSSVKALRSVFRPLKLSGGKKLPVSSIVLLLVFLIVSFLSFSPFLKVVEKQKQLRHIQEEMKQIFISTFPDIHNIVNPLIQAKEKIVKAGDTDIKTGVPSVLKIMADITLLFPENIDAKVDLLRIAGNTITLSGTADSLKTLEKIKDRIEKSGRFTIIDIGTISFDARNRANFNITLKVD